MTPTLLRARPLIGAAAGLFCTAALAHHPMDGQMPTSLASGLLSGLGHPVIEPVHLLFLVGAAALAGVSRMPLGQALALLVVYVLASTVGTAMNITPSAAALQLALGASLVALVPWVWLRRAPVAPAAWALATAAGLAHGLAFAETVVGAEATPLLAYLAGLAIVQSGLLLAVCLAVRRAIERHPRMLSIGSRALASGLFAAGLGFALIGA